MPKNSLLIFLITVATLMTFSGNKSFAQNNNASGIGSALDKAPSTNPVINGNFSTEKTYKIAALTVSGQQYLDDEIIKTISGLSVDQNIKLPNDEHIANAIRILWNQGMFSDIQIIVKKIEDDKLFLDIHIAERPRLTGFQITGIPNGQQSELRDKLKSILVVNRMITESLRKEVEEKVRKYYADKGFMNVATTIADKREASVSNGAFLIININKGGKVRINQINFVGNDNARSLRLKRVMKGTKEMPRLSLYPANKESVYGSKTIGFKDYLNNTGYLSPSFTLEALDPYFRWNVFSGSKFNATKYDDDKNSVLGYYNSIGYRDAQVKEDTTYFVKNGNLNVDIRMHEGDKYYFGDIHWKGNTKYSDSILTKVLGIKKGDILSLIHI